MADHTHIEWCDSTFNPWIGCTKISPACDHCYAETLMDKRMGRARWGAGLHRVRTSPANWRKPVQWNRADFEQCGNCRQWLPGYSYESAIRDLVIQKQVTERRGAEPVEVKSREEQLALVLNWANRTQKALGTELGTALAGSLKLVTASIEGITQQLKY